MRNDKKREASGAECHNLSATQVPPPRCHLSQFRRGTEDLYQEQRATREVASTVSSLRVLWSHDDLWRCCVPAFPVRH
jgi:hypothetical protein